MDRNFNPSVNLLPELVFVVTVMLIIYSTVFDRYEAHPLLALNAFGLSIYLWFDFQE
jgi:hypothetical protein